MLGEICKNTILTAYDLSDNVSLDNKKPDVILIPSQFSLQPPPTKKSKLNWDTLCSGGGLEHLIQSVIEIKAYNKPINDNDTYKGQTISYLHRILTLHPERKEVFGALTNGTQIIIFFRVTREETNIFKYYESNLYTFIDFNENEHNKEGLQYLACMIQGTTIDIPLPNSNLVLESYLGRGATSVVYESQTRAVKLCSSARFEQNFEQEAKTLSFLSKYLAENCQTSIPKLLGAGSNYLLFPIYKKLPFNAFQKKFSFALFLPIIDMLENVHKLGVCHGDIRPENLLVNDDNNLVLIDWGFSELKSAYSVATFYGTASFCASEFGRNRLDQKSSSYQPNYDLESLLKTMFFFWDTELQEKLEIIGKFSFKDRLTAALEIWDEYRSDLIPNSITHESLRKVVKQLTSLQDLEMQDKQ